MSPRENSALQTRLELVRSTIPPYILDRYELLKRSDTALQDCPAALAMATLVSVYRDLPLRRRKNIHSFFDLAEPATHCVRRGLSPRRNRQR